jgi:hypothetical protein
MLSGEFELLEGSAGSFNDRVLLFEEVEVEQVLHRSAYGAL